MCQIVGSPSFRHVHFGGQIVMVEDEAGAATLHDPGDRPERFGRVRSVQHIDRSLAHANGHEPDEDGDERPGELGDESDRRSALERQPVPLDVDALEAHTSLGRIGFPRTDDRHFVACGGERDGFQPDATVVGDGVVRDDLDHPHLDLRNGARYSPTGRWNSPPLMRPMPPAS